MSLTDSRAQASILTGDAMAHYRDQCAGAAKRRLVSALDDLAEVQGNLGGAEMRDEFEAVEAARRALMPVLAGLDRRRRQAR